MDTELFYRNPANMKNDFAPAEKRLREVSHRQASQRENDGFISRQPPVVACRLAARSRVDSPFRLHAALLAFKTLFIAASPDREFTFMMLSKISVSAHAVLVTAATVFTAMLLWQHFFGSSKNNLELALLLAVAAVTYPGSLWLAGAKAPSSVRGGRSRSKEATGLSDDAVLGVTSEGFIISWNAAAERMSGYSAREIIGWHISVMLTPEAFPEQAARLAQACRGERVESEVVCEGKDGSRMGLSVCPDPFLCDDDHGLL